MYRNCSKSKQAWVANMYARLVGQQPTYISGKCIAHLCWTCMLHPLRHSRQWAYMCKKYAMMSSNKQKTWCMNIPSAADTPQDSCLGPKDSRSIAESAPEVVWLSRRTEPTEQHQLCRQEQALTKATFSALIEAKQVWQLIVVVKCNKCAQHDTYCQEISFTVQAISLQLQASLK